MTGQKTGRTNKPGAGRKPTGKPRMVGRNVTLTAEQVAWLKGQGQGNFSAAVREALDVWIESAEQREEDLREYWNGIASGIASGLRG